MKSAHLFIIGFVLSILVAGPLFGQTNTNCANALTLTNAMAFSENTSGANFSGNPTTDCNNLSDLTHGVWFTVTTPTNNVRLDITTCGSSYNTELLVYTNGCATTGTPYFCVRGNNPFGCSSGQAGVSFSAPSNTTYYIFVAAIQGTIAGTLNITATTATPPSNDTCANPIALSSGVMVSTNTFHATEFGEPTSDCNGNSDLTHGVWFTVTTPTNNVRLDITTCGSSYNTELLVYTNGCATTGSPYFCVRGNNPFGCSSGQAGVSFSAPSNTTYYIFVAAIQGTIAGTLNITATTATPPSNDTCANPIALSSGVMVSTNTFHATEFGEPTSDCNGNSDLTHGVWFTVTTPTNNVRLDITTCGSSYNTELLVYTNGCATTGTPYFCVRGNNPFGCSSGQAGVSFSAPSNTTYYIFVAAIQGTIAGTLNITATTATPPSNDTCANPLLLTNGVLVSTNTFHATEFGEPTSDCNGNSDLTHGVWFTVTTPTNNVRLDITTCGSSYNTELLVYTNGCATTGTPYFCVRGNNPFGCSSGQAGVSFSAPSNTTYYIFVAAIQGTIAGTLNITATTATPPSNDTCANPIALSSGVMVSTNTFHATEFGEPTSDCNGNSDLTHGVWFTVTTPTNNVRLDITTCGSSYNTELLVYTNGCATTGSPYFCVRGNNPFGCSSGQAGVSFSAPSNTTYYIFVAAIQGTIAGTLNITATTATPPSNDTCANPIALSSGVMVSTNTFHATEFGEPTSDCNGNSDLTHGVWFTVTTPTNNVRLDITTCGSSYNTELLVYTNGCATTGSPYFCVRGNNPFGCSSGQAGVSFSAPSNTTYYIFVAAIQGTIAGTLNITATTATPPSNDTCANPLLLTNGVLVSTNTFNSTEFGEPTSDCNGNSDLTHGVWFTVTTPTNNVRLDITTCGSSYNTELLVYTNGCATTGSPYFCVRGNNPFGCSSGQAGVSFSAPSNTTYYIFVAAIQGTIAGTLNITATTATPPSNDTCANPLLLTNGVLVSTNTFNSTEFGEPTSDCNGNSDLTHGVWFSLAAFAGQPVTINTCGSSYNTELVLYTNGCGSLGNPFLCVRGSNPFGCSSAQAGVSFIAPTNVTYNLFVASIQGSSGGTLDIVANVPPPTNDTCAGAILMTPGTNYSTNTTYATSIGDPVPDCQPNFGRGVWYKYVPAASGQVGVTTCGSGFQTALAVYTGSCGALTQLVCSQSGGAYCGSGNADVNFMGMAGTTYFILAGGVNGQGGNLQIQIPVVDLVPTSLTATNPAGGLPTAGRGFSASWTIANQGSNSINGSWTDTLILSNATTNVVLANSTGLHNAIAGSGYSARINNQLLPQIPPGQYSLIIQADSSSSVAETNEANNSKPLLITLTNLPPQITLLVSTNLDGHKVCVPQSLPLAAQVTPGSYNIARVDYYDGSTKIATAANGPPYVTNAVIFYGTNSITAQVVDSFGYTATSPSPVVITLLPPDFDLLIGDINSNRDCVFCMGALAGSNYVVQTVTNGQTPFNWQPYVTNVAPGSIFYFTNTPTNSERLFRVIRTP